MGGWSSRRAAGSEALRIAVGGGRFFVILSFEASSSRQQTCSHAPWPAVISSGPVAAPLPISALTKPALRTGLCGFRSDGASAAQQMQKREQSFGIQMLTVQPDTKPKGCAGCSRKIKDRYLLKALDKYWHEDCLKCACCDCRLGEVGSTLYTKANLILCRRDYLRLFGVTGNCAACSKLIPAFEMVMRAKENVYHLDCFACQLCNQRFCVGDKFFLKNNMILCQTDYEEGLMKEGYAAQVR
ncbi:PREDICTED: LIM domain only protein 3 isoform X1 [Cyprinodon variegatus]|uniref:LIM domain only protein 3 n=2 Tax=Cyprinodon variegatus TaxID=28743 RepID=A0A3Q2EF23_CYPVA|nr:PREDICTED: LIM domain only protein 3 isoform X1 [Cyprinodon variegatus]